MGELPHIKNELIEGETFISAIMKPHTSYYKSVKGLFESGKIKGMAHITGGGIEGNLKRIIPNGLCANIDLDKIKILPLFKYIKNNGNISENEMLSTFNCGVGLAVVVSPEHSNSVAKHISQYHNCYPIGEVSSGTNDVGFKNKLVW